MNADDRPFVIESETRVRLGPVAKEWARVHGMSLEQMAEHVLHQDNLRAAGLIQRQGES
jgi:hypothetical protein